MKPARIEVMQFLAQKIDSIIDEFLKKIDTNWQPADFLPDSTNGDFIKDINELQAECKDLPYDYLAVLVGDTITEEALPTYESWLMDVEGITKTEPAGWSKWIRMWSAEENRHGDLLNKFLYLSGRINMREMEISTQYLIADGLTMVLQKILIKILYTHLSRSWPLIFHTVVPPRWQKNMAVTSSQRSVV